VRGLPVEGPPFHRYIQGQLQIPTKLGCSAEPDSGICGNATRRRRGKQEVVSGSRNISKYAPLRNPVEWIFWDPASLCVVNYQATRHHGAGDDRQGAKTIALVWVVAVCEAQRCRAGGRGRGRAVCTTARTGLTRLARLDTRDAGDAGDASDAGDAGDARKADAAARVERWERAGKTG
jgi:hypothetical protein